MKAILEKEMAFGGDGWTGRYTWGPDYLIRKHSTRPSWVVVQDLGTADNSWEFRTLAEVRTFLGSRLAS